MIRIGWVFLLAVLLAGCSPNYNWRQVQVANGAVTAFFPDRPKTEERSLRFNGHDVAFSLTSASVDGALFTVGQAVLPASLARDAQAREAFARAVQHSLYQNLGVEVPSALPPRGQPFVVEGQGAAQGVRLKAMVWLSEYALVEGVVTAQADHYPSDQADEFLRGIRVP